MTEQINDVSALKKCNEECIPLLTCPKVKEILNKSRNKSWIPTEEYDEITNYYCYRKEDVYYVCCPRTLVNENNVPSYNITMNTKLNLPYAQTYTNTYFSIHRPVEVKREDPFSECGRTFNRIYQSGYNTELSDFPWLALIEYNTGK